MSAAAPPSPLIAPDLRRQLQQRYEEAARLAAGESPDCARIHNLLAECVRIDPGNILYLDALLANLRRWRRGSWWTPWRRFWQSQKSDPGLGSVHAVPSAQHAALQAAPAQLRSQPNDAALFRRLASAAGDCDFDEVELRYWELATCAAPAGSDALRGLAQALTRQGRFEQAAAAWETLLFAVPGDAEAARALADLDPQAERGLAQEACALADAQAAGGPLLSIMGQREELQLARARQRLLVARRRAGSDPHPKSQRLVERLAAEHDRLEIEILHLRCERLPGDWQVRLELACRLRAAGNYSGAVQRLEEAARLQPGASAVLVELGECWQHLRQFAKALDFYRQAAAVDRSGQRPLAAYRAAVLAEALGRRDDARNFLAQVLAIDAAFKDARERLDNLERS